MNIFQRMNSFLGSYSETIFVVCSVTLAACFLLLILLGIVDLTAYFWHHICWR